MEAHVIRVQGINARIRRGRQAGFSMVEMLMAAFILSIGLLGLSMLQLMSLRGSRSSQSLTTAVKVGERVMDQIEQEGRLSWLNISSTNLSVVDPLTNLKYISHAAVPDEFTVMGGTPNPLSTDPKTRDVVFRSVATPGAVVVGGSGRLTLYTVVVRFFDDVNQTGTPVERTVTLQRRILHG